MSALHNYLARIHATIFGREEIRVEGLFIELVSDVEGYVEDRLVFYDGSFLEPEEVLWVSRGEVVKLRYRYHYQKGDILIFRYDNAPHYPGLPNFPHYKHVGDRVEPVEQVPDLQEVLREIDQLLYPVSNMGG